MTYIILPLCIFFIFVAPLWLILHYRAQKQSSNGLSAQDQESLQALVKHSEELQKRINTLHDILDKEAPQWRNNKNEQ